MNYELITAPVIGAAIGLITNGIAIKMLFRPWKPIYIGKFRLPFTPGLIPKEQPRIARAIAAVVGNNLLDNDTIKKNLLSDDSKVKITDFINNKINKYSESEMLLSEFLDSKNLLEYIDEKESVIKVSVAETITNKLLKSNVSAQLLDFATEELVKNSNPMIGGLASKAIQSARESIIEKINNIIKEKAPEIVPSLIDKEYQKLKDMPVSECIKILSDKFPDYNEKLWNLYSKLIEEQLGHILKVFNIEKIVEQKINEFELPELERLILSIANKELQSLIALGGILGLLMGFLNVLL